MHEDAVENFLAHFGVKGMRWGIINEKKSEPNAKNANIEPLKKRSISKEEQAVLDKLAPMGYNENQLKRRFGPEEPEKKLTENQKKALYAIGIAVALGGTAYALKRYNLKDASKLENLGKEISIMNQLKMAGNDGGYNSADIAKMSTKRLELNPGDIVHRVSLSKEEYIRDNFFAATSEEDLARYKAILPIYWKDWTGKQNPEGFIINIKAKKKVLAPSELETYNIFKDLFDKTFQDPSDSKFKTLREMLQATPHGPTSLSDDELNSIFFHRFAGLWNQPNHPITKAMFDRVKELGFNAIPDMNDANNLANAPHILFDGSMFEIIGTEPHKRSQIKKAQQAVVSLVHFIMSVQPFERKNFMQNDEVENFLAHFGVKGMRWGVINSRDSGVSSRQVDRQARKDAEEFARARMFYGEGAGTRRKLINASVKQRSKNIPEYQKAFDFHLKNQDMSKHSDKAVSERNRIDRSTKTKKTAGAVARRLTGEMGTQAAFVAVAFAGAAYLKSPRGRMAMNVAAKKVKNLNDSIVGRRAQNYVADWLKGQ